MNQFDSVTVYNVVTSECCLFWS